MGKNKDLKKKRLNQAENNEILQFAKMQHFCAEKCVLLQPTHEISNMHL
jgi:hypothetical protein